MQHRAEPFRTHGTWFGATIVAVASLVALAMGAPEKRHDAPVIAAVVPAERQPTPVPAGSTAQVGSAASTAQVESAVSAAASSRETAATASGETPRSVAAGAEQSARRMTTPAPATNAVDSSPKRGSVKGE